MHITREIVEALVDKPMTEADRVLGPSARDDIVTTGLSGHRMLYMRRYYAIDEHYFVLTTNDIEPPLPESPGFVVESVHWFISKQEMLWAMAHWHTSLLAEPEEPRG